MIGKVNTRIEFVGGNVKTLNITRYINIEHNQVRFRHILKESFTIPEENK